MKNTIRTALALSMVVGFFSAYANAAETKGTGIEEKTMTTSADVNNSIEMVRTLYHADKKAIVADNLGLTDKESTAFWKVYNEFQVELRKVGDKRLDLIKRFGANYENLNDQTASSLLDDSFKIDKEEIKVRETFKSKFMKVLPMVKVARYYQIENKIGAITKVSIANEIPLAK